VQLQIDVPVADCLLGEYQIAVMRTADDDERLLKSVALPGASAAVSSRDTAPDESVKAAMQQMMAMQSQFLEQSQLQMDLMRRLMDHFGGNQPPPIHQDAKRIEQLIRDLERIKADLADDRSRRQKIRGRRPKTHRVAWNPFWFLSRIRQ